MYVLIKTLAQHLTCTQQNVFRFSTSFAEMKLDTRETGFLRDVFLTGVITFNSATLLLQKSIYLDTENNCEVADKVYFPLTHMSLISRLKNVAFRSEYKQRT